MEKKVSSGEDDDTELQRSILRRVCNLKMWRKGRETAPHKPILILYALSRIGIPDEPRLIPFAEIESALVPLLKTVLRNKPLVEPRYPFWRLQNDQLWEVVSSGPMKVRRGNTDPLRSELISKTARGGFPEDVYQVLRGDRSFRARVRRLVLERYFSDAEQDALKKLVEA